MGKNAKRKNNTSKARKNSGSAAVSTSTSTSITNPASPAAPQSPVINGSVPQSVEVNGGENGEDIAARNLEILNSEFLTTLDAALIAAIHNDTPHNLDTARNVLRSLSSETVLDPENDNSFSLPEPFNPLSLQDASSSHSGGKSHTSSSVVSSSEYTGTTYSGDCTDDELLAAYYTALSPNSSKEEKVRYLKTMFTTLNKFTIIKAVEGMNGRGLEGVIDELLNRLYLEEGGLDDDETETKGVEAFAVEEEYFTNGKGKRKGGRRKNSRTDSIPLNLTRRNSDDLASSLPWYRPGESDWARGEREISLLSTALNIPQPIVQSTYHSCGRKISGTVHTIVQRERSAMLAAVGRAGNSTELSSREEEVVALLERSFPEVRGWVWKGLVRLAMGSWEYGEGSNEALSTPTSPATPVAIPLPPPPSETGWSVTGRGGKVKTPPVEHVSPPQTFIPLPTSNGWQKKRKLSSPRILSEEEVSAALSTLFDIGAYLQADPNPQPPNTTPPSTPALPNSPTTPPALASINKKPHSHAHPPTTISINSRDHIVPTSIPTLASPTSPTTLYHSRSAAASLYRRATRSNHFGQAASYYSTQSRLIADSLRADSSPEGPPQTTIDPSDGYIMLDLHGYRLQEAVVATKHVVAKWWEVKKYAEPGAGRRRGGAPGVRVITGKGRHSQGGKGVLGPGVVGALRREGWRVEVGSGWIEVKGKVGR